ncbi:pentapeptide repeat-containing protein [Nonomuraea sp. NPDC000554]|uniref:pentapeptide repeat-containing protein n=1 Tax=Nonomuraea sp. NPDC000554 TaxID=3154259 RepID=UPI0033334E45
MSWCSRPASCSPARSAGSPASAACSERDARLPYARLHGADLRQADFSCGSRCSLPAE